MSLAGRAWHRNCVSHVVLRITFSSEGSRTVLRLAGELVEEGVAELEKVVSSYAGEIVVDLSELRFADPSAIRTLLAIADNGVELRRPSPYIRLLLTPYIRLLLTRELARSVNRQSEHLEKK